MHLVSKSSYYYSKLNFNHWSQRSCNKYIIMHKSCYLNSQLHIDVINICFSWENFIGFVSFLGGYKICVFKLFSSLDSIFCQITTGQDNSFNESMPYVGPFCIYPEYRGLWLLFSLTNSCLLNKKKRFPVDM